MSRFLSEETEDRERARRATTAAKAAVIAGKASESADDNLGQLTSLVRPLATMATRAVRRVSFPDEATNLRPALDAKEADALQQLARLDEGQREWWEPIAAKDQIRAAAVAKDVLAHLIELAGASPRPTDPKDLAAIRAAIAEVFGYGAPEAAGEAVANPQEAPPTPEEHTPPVVH